MSITMYDSVTVSTIPGNATAVAGYVDGLFDNFGALVAAFPHAHHLSITVTPGVGAACCDCEVGDLSVGEAIGWVQFALDGGIWRPCVYANADRWENQGLRGALAHYGNRIRRWIAAYPGTGANVPAGYDAHQYSDNALGRNLDASVCRDDFFGSAPPKRSGVAKLNLSYGLSDGTWDLQPLPGHVTFAAPKQWASAEVQVDVSSGHWRIASEKWNAGPLGATPNTVAAVRSGIAEALVTYDLGTGHWTVASEPGEVTFAAPKQYASVEIQLDVSSGAWRYEVLPWDAKPLGS